MAVVQPPAELSDILAELEAIISGVGIKNTTMINYYIFPDPTPNQIAAFAPRLDALAERRDDLAALSLAHLPLLVDDAPHLLAAHLMPIAQQISAAVRLFQLIFIEHYDRSLTERKPYLNLFRRTKHVEAQLQQFMMFHQQNPNRRPAVSLQPPPSTTQPSLCPMAIAFVNGQDRGRIQTCLPHELVAENKAVLKNEGGVFLWWECMGCAFRLRFHINNSAAMNINSTAEIRRHEGIPGIEYRSSWLAKCHLYHPGRDEQVRERERRRESMINGSGIGGGGNNQGSGRSSTIITITKTYGKKSRTASTSTSNSTSINTTGVDGMKYGCPFCFACGKTLAATTETTFANAQNFAAHLESSHSKILPSPPLLQQLKVGFNGQTAPGINRWDLNIG